jgi:D-sedoheptulose 7-phosphate isomerase
MKDRIRSAILETADLIQTMAEDTALHDHLHDAVKACLSSLQQGGKLMFCGNGGSAADAQHWAGELVSRFYYDRPGLAAIALTTDTSILTAIGNDYGYEQSFSRQVEALGRAGDVLIVISTSGNSKNVIRAVEAAKQREILVIGFSGQATSAMASRCDINLNVPSLSTPRIQEGHEVLGHTLCMLIEEALYPPAARS